LLVLAEQPLSRPGLFWVGPSRLARIRFSLSWRSEEKLRKTH
jgi:hypothetical protein